MIDIRQIVGGVLLFVSGLEKLIEECKDFYELEKGVHELTRGLQPDANLGTGTN